MHLVLDPRAMAPSPEADWQSPPAIAHAHVKTDRIDAGVLASLHAAGFLAEVWTPPAETERMRRLVATRNQVAYRLGDALAWAEYDGEGSGP